MKTRTVLEEFIQDIIGILDSAQIEWLEKNKGYYLYKDQLKTNDIKTKQCRCERLR